MESSKLFALTRYNLAEVVNYFAEMLKNCQLMAEDFSVLSNPSPDHEQEQLQICKRITRVNFDLQNIEIDLSIQQAYAKKFTATDAWAEKLMQLQVAFYYTKEILKSVQETYFYHLNRHDPHRTDAKTLVTQLIESFANLQQTLQEEQSARDEYFGSVWRYHYQNRALQGIPALSWLEQAVCIPSMKTTLLSWALSDSRLHINGVAIKAKISNAKARKIISENLKDDSDIAITNAKDIKTASHYLRHMDELFALFKKLKFTKSSRKALIQFFTGLENKQQAEFILSNCSIEHFLYQTTVYIEHHKQIRHSFGNYCENAFLNLQNSTDGKSVNLTSSNAITHWPLAQRHTRETLNGRPLLASYTSQYQLEEFDHERRFRFALTDHVFQVHTEGALRYFPKPSLLRRFRNFMLQHEVANGFGFLSGLVVGIMISAAITALMPYLAPLWITLLFVGLALSGGFTGLLASCFHHLSKNTVSKQLIFNDQHKPMHQPDVNKLVQTSPTFDSFPARVQMLMSEAAERSLSYETKNTEANIDHAETEAEMDAIVPSAAPTLMR